MAYYIIALIVTLLFSILSLKTKSKIWKKIMQFLSFLPFTLTCGLRAYSIGIDTYMNYIPNYLIAVNYGKSIDFFSYFSYLYSFGFTLILYVLSNLFESPTALLMFCSIITNGLVFKCIYQESKKPIISICIYFFSGAFMLSMNGMRGYMAMSIVLYSIKYIKSRQLKYFLLYIIIAFFIHPTSIIFIILYPLYNFYFKNIHIIILFFISPIIVLFGTNIIYFFLKNTSFVNYFNSTSTYIDPLYTMLVINFILLFIFSLNYNSYKNNKEYNLYLKLQVLSLLVCLMSFTLTQSYRLEQMVDFFQIITIPYNIYILKNNKNIDDITKKVFILSIFILFGTYFSKSLIINDTNQVRDYRSILNKR